MDQPKLTHDDYVEQFGQTLEALIMIFSASVLIELKAAVDSKTLTEVQAEGIYERIGNRLGEAMAQVDARLAQRADEAEARAKLITLEEHHD